mgnify:CR=1 FL=1
MHPFRDDRLAICSFNHSGNSLLIYSCSKTRLFLMFWNMNNSDVLSGFEPEITEPKSVVLPLHHKTECGTDRTRTYELRREEIYSLRQLPLCDDPKVRKGEDGSVDISFYDWHYYDDFKLRMYHLHHQVNIHSFPNQPLYFQISLLDNFKFLIKYLLKFIWPSSDQCPSGINPSVSCSIF